MKKTQKATIGTSYHNSNVIASVEELKAILGSPNFEENTGEDKVNFSWDMETWSGEVFTVYDWKEYRAISETEKIEWHIGGKSFSATDEAKKEINLALTSLRNKSQRPTPSAPTLLKENEQLKEQVNKLQGYQAYVAEKIFYEDESILTFDQWVESSYRKK